LTVLAGFYTVSPSQTEIPMPATIEILGPCKKRLRVEVTAERVAGTRAEVLREIKQAASIPGFRPGKAPEPLVEKRYAGEIADEVRKHLIPEAYREAITDLKLHVVGPPHVEEVKGETGQGLVFTAVVDTAPDFKLPEYKGIALKRKETPVKDEDVTQALTHLRDQGAAFEEVTGRGIQNGDFAVVTYSAVVDGKPVSELSPEAKTLGENKDFWLLVQPDSFLPKFCDQLLGATPGEKRQVLVDFPADFPQALLAGKKATYFVDVTGLREKKLPELNDEFAKKNGAETVAKLQESVRKYLEHERKNEAESDLRNQVVNHLLGKVEFELPESLVQAETRHVVYDLVRENTMRGATKEQLAEKKDEIFGFAQQTARERLKSSFILEAIAEAEKITVAPKDVDERIAQMAVRYRVTPQRMRAQLEEKDSLGEIEEQLLIGKALDFLVANATVEVVV
jgi:trigger factor